MSYQGEQQNTPQQPANPQPQGPLSDVERMAEQQVDQQIENLAKKIPGGEKFAQQAKDASHGALENLEREAEKRLGSLGDLFGHKPPEQ